MPRNSHIRTFFDPGLEEPTLAPAAGFVKMIPPKPAVS